MLSNIALLTALLLPSTAFGGTFCSGQDFCITTTASGSDVVFTVTSAAKGWMGIGLGSTMATSDMFVFWKSSNSSVVSYRKSTANEMPAIANTISVTPMTMSQAAPGWCKLSAQFKVPAASVHAKLAEKHFIAAYSDAAPAKPDDPASSYPKHSAYKIFDAELDVAPAPADAKPAASSSAAASASSSAAASASSSAAVASPTTSSTALPTAKGGADGHPAPAEPHTAAAPTDSHNSTVTKSHSAASPTPNIAAENSASSYSSMFSVTIFTSVWILFTLV